MYCPKCRTQYIEKVEECFDCKVPLVDELPKETPLEKIKRGSSLWNKIFGTSQSDPYGGVDFIRT